MNRIIQALLISIAIVAVIFIVLSALAWAEGPFAVAIIIMLIVPAYALNEIGILPSNLTDNEAAAISLCVYVIILTAIILLIKKPEKRKNKEKSEMASNNAL